MKHLHWEFAAYNEKEGENGMRFPVLITVVDQPLEVLALKQVKKVVRRKFYWLKTVWECKQCGLQEKQHEMLEKFLKKIHE